MEDLNRIKQLAGLPETKVTIQGDPEFMYNDDMPHDKNFIEWHQMNRREYTKYGKQYPYTKEQAERIFDLYWGHKKLLPKSQPDLPGMEPDQEEPRPEESNWDRAMRHNKEAGNIKSIKVPD